MPLKRQQHTWADLEGKIALEVLQAPQTCGDPEAQEGEWPEVHSRIITYLERSIWGTPWMNHLALLAAVLTARRRDVNTVVRCLTGLHARFADLFPALHLSTMNDWDANTHVRAYLRAEVRPEDTPATRSRFWRDYRVASKQLQSWHQALPESHQALLAPFLFAPVPSWAVEGLDKQGEVEQQQKQRRKTETDAVVPRLSALRAEAHFRYNKLVRLRQAYQQALGDVLPDRSNLPLDFSYDEGNPLQERLHFRIWDRRSFTLAHDYSSAALACAQTGKIAYAQERNTFFLEFIKAERLSDAAPPEGFWFIDLLKMNLIGQKLALGAKLAERAAWLEAWGYGEERAGTTSPFWTQVPGLLAWSQADSLFMSTAQQKAAGVLVPLEPLYAAATFGLLAVDVFTTTGMRVNEASQIRLSDDCFVRLIMNAPPGAKDQTPRVRYAFRLIPKGERTDTPQNYFIGEETKRLLVKGARMLAEHYDLQSGQALPSVPFNPANGRSHRFGKAPYLFQYNHCHFTDITFAACMRFLLHGMIFRTHEGQQVVLKPHLLRHTFATHAVQVEKIPIDIVGEWLKQKNLDVTDYYSQPTESMVAEAADHYLSRVAVSVHLHKAVQRSPQELQKLYHEAKGKAGTLAEVIGGHCISHGFCAAKFACVGCPGKVPDPAKRGHVERHKVWALEQVQYAVEEGLLPEAGRMKQLVRDCETELCEMDQIESFRRDESRVPIIDVKPPQQ